MLATIFSTRTLGLTGQLAPEQQSDYLSGLLIGHELRGLNEVLASSNRLAGKTLRLIGNEALCERYRLALRAVRLQRGEARRRSDRTRPVSHRVAGGARESGRPARARS